MTTLCLAELDTHALQMLGRRPDDDQGMPHVEPGRPLTRPAAAPAIGDHDRFVRFALGAGGAYREAWS
ncbi:MAG: hypothetical protein KDJ14_15640 [Xanthomonadales bacterium]|nr:hypothetical protein [Xanthomonadales bacterium]